MYVGEAHKKMEIDIDEIFKTDIEISNLLVEILRVANAGWAIIWQFHNGGMTMNGFPFLRISATHEQTRVTQEHIAHLYQSLPTSLLIDGTGNCDINKLQSETLCVGAANNSAIKGIMTAHGMSAVHLCALRNSKGSLVGFLSVCYVDKENLTPEDCSILEDYAERAQILLDIMDRVTSLTERM